MNAKAIANAAYVLDRAEAKMKAVSEKAAEAINEAVEKTRVAATKKQADRVEAAKKKLDEAKAALQTLTQQA